VEKERDYSMEKLLNVQEISDLLGVKPSTIRKWVHHGFIPYVKLGGAVRFDLKAIEDWISEKSRAAYVGLLAFPFESN
jgi:excisionase family DNA binding protein